MSALRLFMCLAIVLIAVIATAVASVKDSSGINQFSEIASTPSYDDYASNKSDKSHNLMVGYRVPGDKHVLRQYVIENTQWCQVTSITKTFYTSRPSERITQLNALDQETDGNGAYANLVGGGPGYNYITLTFQSQIGYGINFIVDLDAIESKNIL